MSIDEWVCKTASSVKTPNDWYHKWIDTYFELGGTSSESASKGCPMNAAKTLWYLGRLNCVDRPYLDWDYRRIRDQLSKNGLYAILTIEILEEQPNLTITQIWQEVKKRFGELFPTDSCASSNQGGPTVAFKLWHMGLVKA